MTPRFPRGSHSERGQRNARRGSRAFALGASLLVAALHLGCPDGSVSNNQVCQFQCDYTQDGTELGYPAEAAGVEARLTVQDVVQVIANAIHEAEANGIPDITIVVLDHLSNVLAVYDTDAATTNYSLITSVESPNRTANTPFIVEANAGSADFSGVATTAGLTSLQTALDGIFIPAGYAAISKAGTSNYFSTQGNAFTSRTASTLIQQNFFPGETDRPGGPLFAVQIAQLVCSDINTRQSVDQLADATVADDPTDLIGPRRLPVGFAADPGGISLYKDNIAELDAPVFLGGAPTGRVGKVVVGAVGIEFNGIYGLDKDGTDRDRNLEERIAYGATIGAAAAQSFDADVERRASRITVAGRALRWVDDTGLRASRATAPVISPADVANIGAINARLNGLINLGSGTGQFVSDQFFFPFTEPRAGVFFLDATSGVIGNNFADTDVAVSNGYVGTANGEKLVDALGADRYPAIDSVNPAPPADPANPALADGLSAADVQELLIEALLLAENTRAQTRRPLGGQARIDVAVVDLDGNVLGFARSQDALLDGVDVTIAKTRQAAFWSKGNARTQLEDALDPLGNNGNLLNTRSFDQYLADTRTFLGLAPADPLFEGELAWSSIALGGIANPDFPPGVASGDNGPLSRDPESTTATGAPTDFGEWSIFSTGIQAETVLPGLAVGLCEEVPDLAGVLFDLNAAAGLGAAPPPGGRSALFTDAAQRDAFCDGVRTFLIGSPDAGAQLDCIQGTQDFPAGSGNITGLQNGFHIFQGAVPIYRTDATGEAVLVGAYGVSGDGAEQDDFVPFVALDEIGKAQVARGIPNPIGNAPPVGVDTTPVDGRPDVQRADNMSVQNVFLRYVICPVAPFLSSNEQNGCEGR